MEIAIYIGDINKLSQCATPYKSMNKVIYDKYGDIYKKIEEKYNKQQPDILYFGSEFCQKLIPTKEDCKKAYTYAIDNNMKFSYVTPGTFDKGMDLIDESLSFLNEIRDNVEVVCNDWGTVQLIKNKYENLSIVLGRMIDKLSREPRLSTEQFSKIYGEVGLSFLQTPNISVKEYHEILKKYGVKMVEFDCVPQGLNLESIKDLDCPVKIGLHMPYYYVTTGQICMTQLVKSDENDKYNFVKGCAKLCRKYDIFMQKQTLGNNENVDLELIRKGNTIYKAIDDIQNYLDKDDCYERIIIQTF